MYKQFVELHAEAFGPNRKTAEDIAKILDHPLVQVREGDRFLRNLSEERCKVLKGFYAACVQSGVTLPKIEDIFCNEQERRKIFMDGYLERFQPSCLYPQGVSRPVHVLIVDDIPDDFLTSAYALVGIPNLTVDFYHCDVRRLTEEMQWDEVFQKVCEDIDSASKDIVLMDQEFGHVLIKGSKIVEKLKGDNSKLLFIANTAGMSVKLEAAGCLPNFDKGINSEGILQALGMYI